MLPHKVPITCSQGMVVLAWDSPRIPLALLPLGRMDWTDSPGWVLHCWEGWLLAVGVVQRILPDTFPVVRYSNGLHVTQQTLYSFSMSNRLQASFVK